MQEAFLDAEQSVLYKEQWQKKTSAFEVRIGAVKEVKAIAEHGHAMNLYQVRAIFH